MRDEEYFNPETFLLIRDQVLNLWDEISHDLKEFKIQSEKNSFFPVGEVDLIRKIQFKIVTALHYSGMMLNLYERLKSLQKSNEELGVFILNHSKADDIIIKMLFAIDRVNNIQKHLLMANIKEENDAFVGIVKDDKKFYWVRDNVSNVSSIKGKTKKQIDDYKSMLSQQEIAVTIPQIKSALFGVGIPRIPIN